MAIQLYNPFESLHFNPVECFLTGKRISSTEEQISVFPEWLINRYSLKDKTFTMLEQNIVKYQDLKLPCYIDVIENALNPLEEEIKKAFSAGFEEVKKCRKYGCFNGWLNWCMVFYTTILFMQ